MPQNPNVWRIGDVQITRIVEIEIRHGHRDLLFSGLTADQVKKIGWLQPHFADASGLIKSSIQAFVVESKDENGFSISAYFPSVILSYPSTRSIEPLSFFKILRRTSFT